jgi:hypothetical protein
MIMARPSDNGKADGELIELGRDARERWRSGLPFDSGTLDLVYSLSPARLEILSEALGEEARRVFLHEAQQRTPDPLAREHDLIEELRDARTEHHLRQLEAGRPLLSADAFYGPLGALVRAVEPYIEADPAAVLATVLTAFGSTVGPSPHYRVRGVRHRCNLFTVIVGNSATGAKGESLSDAMRLVRGIDGDWDSDHHLSGFGSGQAMIGRLAQLEAPGADMRRLIVEQEFSHVLKMAARDGSIVSETMRHLYDGWPIANVVKKESESATCRDHYVAVLGHCTPGSLRDGVERASFIADGSLNRYLIVSSRRDSR